MSSLDRNEIMSLVNSSVCTYQAGDKSALDDIYEHLNSFCLRIISKTCGKYVTMDDEQAIIVPHVILDVLDRYDPQKGGFMVYLGQAVRNRTIDGARKAKRNPCIPMSSLNWEQTGYMEHADSEFAETVIDNIARRQEIESLARLLQGFNIDFQQLAKTCPRQKKTRLQAQQVARLIVQNPELRAYLLENRLLPKMLLEEKYHVNRQVIDRYRKYIIATVLIMINDFDYLRPYVLPA